ncbi:MAG TPA: hypothetical protein VKZ53_00935 [Candidatus Angelobacter sp.]|nr:hypothetical protein [Candidatus Angelobacter sp.]
MFVSEPRTDSIAVINLSDDGTVFHVAGVRHLASSALHKPVDLAPAKSETSNRQFAGNTTLTAGSDFFVANREDNTIVRMRQDGTVSDVRVVRLADGRSLGHARLNGIAISPDGTTIYVTVTGHIPGICHSKGAVLALPVFGNQKRGGGGGGA